MPVKRKSRQKEGGESLHVFPPLEPEAGAGGGKKEKGRLFRAAFLMPNYSKFLFSYLYSEYQTRRLRETSLARYFGV